MFSTSHRAAAAYGAVHVETNIVDADPHRLVQLLFDGAVDAVAKARFALRHGDVPTKGWATSKAIRILDEGLKAALDKRAGDLAYNLDSLYGYMTRTLLRANLESNDALYAEVEALLAGLRDSWSAIRDVAVTRAGVPIGQAALAL